MGLKCLSNGANFAISFKALEDDHDNDDEDDEDADDDDDHDDDDDDDDEDDDDDGDDDDTISDVEWRWCDSVSGVSGQPPVIKLRSSGSF